MKADHCGRHKLIPQSALDLGPKGLTDSAFWSRSSYSCCGASVVLAVKNLLYSGGRHRYGFESKQDLFGEECTFSSIVVVLGKFHGQRNSGGLQSIGP